MESINKIRYSLWLKIYEDEKPSSEDARQRIEQEVTGCDEDFFIRSEWEDMDLKGAGQLTQTSFNEDK